MTDENERMSVATFRKLGYLQELNRQFLHPLGHSIDVVIDADGAEFIGGIWDYRHDPDGVRLPAADVAKDDARERARRIAYQQRTRREAREAALGYWIQPVPGAEDPK